MDLVPLVVEALRVSRRYGRTHALCAVDLAIEEGCVYGVIGANGAGKTTLLRVLQGREVPDEGRVVLFGRDARILTRSERARCGVQLERGGFPPYLRAMEALSWLRSLYAEGECPATLLEALGIGDCSDRLVRDLSTGWHRRLAVAGALIGRPRLVFLDEPSLGLDLGARDLLWQLLRGVAAGGTSSVIATNSMEEAEALCDRVAFLQRGRVVEEGGPREVIERRASRSEGESPARLDRRVCHRGIPA